jgi:hypothetical protein
MLARFLWIAVLVFCLFGVTLVSAQTPADAGSVRDAQMKADFDLVDKIGSRNAYRIFIETYRSGDLVETARKRMEKPGEAPERGGDQQDRPRIKM